MQNLDTDTRILLAGEHVVRLMDYYDSTPSSAWRRLSRLALSTMVAIADGLVVALVQARYAWSVRQSGEPTCRKSPCKPAS